MTTSFVAAQPERDHTLVVIFLRGGADGLTLAPPLEDDGYHNARPQLRIRKGDALPLNDQFGLHPDLAPLLPFYHAGQLALIHAVGSEDTTRSHFEAQDLMEQGGPAGGGWLGRYLRQTPRAGSNPLAAVALGTSAPESLRGAPASVVLDSLDAFSFGDSGAEYLSRLETLYQKDSSDLGRIGCDALTAVHKIQELGKSTYSPSAGAVYVADTLGQELRRVAQLITSGVGMEAATIDLDGWDSHFAQSPLIGPLMRSLASNLAAFATDLGPRLDRVSVVVMSEFGRRVFENASFGTDHGRGGVMFTLGGGVRGGAVYGEWTGLGADALEGPGDVPVTTNYRDVLAAVLQRCGGMQDLASVFPGFPVTPLALYA